MNGIRRIPTIKLWDLLLVPLQGEIGDHEIEQLMNDVLGMIRDAEIRGLVIDVTGMWLMDSHLCASLSKLAQAAALMGARTVLCGLRPEVGVTLQIMGLELRQVMSVPNLERALTVLGFGPIDEKKRMRTEKDARPAKRPDPAADA
jgi:rsbT antagonist protein RsbS